MVLQHLLSNFQQPGSYELALKWLYRLYVAHADIDITSAAAAAASAHITQPQVKQPLLLHMQMHVHGSLTQGENAGVISLYAIATSIIC